MERLDINYMLLCGRFDATRFGESHRRRVGYSQKYPPSATCPSLLLQVNMLLEPAMLCLCVPRHDLLPGYTARTLKPRSPHETCCERVRSGYLQRLAVCLVQLGCHEGRHVYLQSEQSNIFDTFNIQHAGTCFEFTLPRSRDVSMHQN